MVWKKFINVVVIQHLCFYAFCQCLLFHFVGKKVFFAVSERRAPSREETHDLLLSATI